MAKICALVLATYGPVCHLCRQPIQGGLPPRHPRRPSVDHVIPRSLGGTDDLDNLRPAHYGCNAKRGNRLLTPALFAEFKPRPRRRSESGLAAGFS